MAEEEDSEAVVSTVSIAYDELTFQEQLGSGGFSTVFSGTCRGIPVAIKLLKRKYLPEKLLALFAKEIEVMESLRHPNVLNYLGVCLEGDNFMVVTERMDIDLCSYLFDISQPGSKESLSLYERGKMAKGVALGCLWIHSVNILHRDLKSANILLNKKNLEVKICDFGLSQIKTSEEDMLKDSGSPKGTLAWMAPEVLGRREFNEKSDVWSFGVVLWELFKIPYDLPHRGVSREKIVEIVTVDKKPPKYPSTVIEGSSLHQLFDSCFRPDPKDRPSFEQLVKEFPSVLVDLAIDDTDGRVFWKENFIVEGIVEEKVPWSKFSSSLPNYIPSKDVGDVFGRECLKKLVTETDRSFEEEIVSLTSFAKLMKFFPFLPTYKHSFVRSISRLCQEKYFFGPLSSHTAVSCLSSQPFGTFLIRFSSTSSEPVFTLSFQSSMEGGKVSHIRLPFDPLSGEVSHKNSTFPSLYALVSSFSEMLLQPCPGHPFAEIESGYLYDADDLPIT